MEKHNNIIVSCLQHSTHLTTSLLMEKFGIERRKLFIYIYSNIFKISSIKNKINLLVHQLWHYSIYLKMVMIRWFSEYNIWWMIVKIENLKTRKLTLLQIAFIWLLVGAIKESRKDKSWPVLKQTNCNILGNLCTTISIIL